MSTESESPRKLNVAPATDEELRAKFNTARPKGEAGDYDTEYAEALADEEESTENRTDPRKAFLKIGGGVLAFGVAVTGGAYAIGNSAHDSHPKSTTEGTAPVSPNALELPSASATSSPLDLPSASPSPSAINTVPTGSPEIKKSRYTVTELKAMPVADYNKLPHDDRMVYAESLLKEAQGVYLDYSKDSYQYNPLEVASPQNTPDQIVKQLQFAAEVPFRQGVTDLADDVRLDANKAKKALSILFYETSGKTSDYFMATNATIENTPTQIKFGEHWTDAKEIAPVETAVDQSGKTIEYRTLSFTDQNGVAHRVKATYAPLTGDKHIWQVYELV